MLVSLMTGTYMKHILYENNLFLFVRINKELYCICFVIPVLASNLVHSGDFVTKTKRFVFGLSTGILTRLAC